MFSFKYIYIKMGRLKLIIFLLLLIPAFVFSQELKEIKKPYIKPGYTEFYTILKLNHKQHGKYQILGSNDHLLTEGVYNSGLKDSIWVEYYAGTNKVKWKGEYDEDEQVGIWEYFDYEGNLHQQYDYTEKRVFFENSPEESKGKEFKVLSGADTIKAKLDMLPGYIGGAILINESIMGYIKYPLKAIRDEVSGEVIVDFVIDSTGKAIDHKVVKGVSAECDAEALRVIKLIPDHWIPGQIREKKVNTIYSLPIMFRLLE